MKNIATTMVREKFKFRDYNSLIKLKKDDSTWNSEKKEEILEENRGRIQRKDFIEKKYIIPSEFSKGL